MIRAGKSKNKEGSNRTFVFIDASNIIYGTKDDGWKVDFAKLYKYLRERFECKRIFYFGGFNEDNTKQAHFYTVLRNLGYELVLRKVKIFKQDSAKPVRKANCDVDLAFYAMKYTQEFNRIIFFSGDGDFDLLLKHFIELEKEVIVFANAKRTAKEIKQLKGISFNDMKVLRPIIGKKP